MPKTAKFTTITPMPAGITRKSVLDMYRDHLAMIDLNPLVIERYKCKPPNYAPTSEYYATWYTIKDKVSYLPGGLATGSVSYHAVFHDLPDCLETHVYAPLGLDIRGKWSVGGSLPGEPKQHTESGHKASRNGLYIREEVSMTCSKLLLGFVKKTFKDSHSRLVEKLVERAHILESNFANERLKALRHVEPRERMAHGDIFIAPPPDYQFAPPPYQAQASPRFFPRLRSQSVNPIPTLGLSQSSSFNERSASVSSAPAQQNRLSPSQSALHSNGPEQSVYLLPATTYDGGLSASFNRPISLYPGRASHAPSIRVASLYYETMVDETGSDEETDEEAEPISTHTVSPPRIPEARPISFNFAFNQISPGPLTPISNEELLADIDAAIDESYIYSLPNTRYDALPTPNYLHAASQITTLPATTYEILPTTTYKAPPTTIFNTLPATTYNATPEPTLDMLPSTTYTPGPFLPSTTYELKHERKDSVIPYHAYSESPPVPPKDGKYRRPSQVAV
ncbi:uncharacterized protein EKO05_0008788 [Ascochyta rabiei]|uniref:DUF7053 domain-containing protein n=1 Tax=Didymella rabiei TaxID=5454 RepID=A0A163JYU8_DIDRA|nr:uncharacterized protein EKO05_0008788 [Ascochyta rabiei]KZM26673.1 hypothetical protein ST47_g2171 [Ascochyta rabiei]UPX18489.1 hypothetical protein EKO05_0008788 [Ascochyta rabiei]